MIIKNIILVKKKKKKFRLDFRFKSTLQVLKKKIYDRKHNIIE